MTAKEQDPGSKSRSRPATRDSPGERPTAFDRSLSLLARRTHFSAELRRKLTQRGYEVAEVEAALDRLRELGYLDDRAAAREYVRLQRERRGWGSSRLRAELVRRGVADSHIAAALEELNEEGERDLARREMDRWQARGGGDPARLARRLERKGFPARVIVSLLEEAGLDPWSSD